MSNLPLHVGVIMDGNGRWAKNQGLSRSEGHVKGALVFKDIMRHASMIGIKHLTMYAFSTENWKREKEEVDALMALFCDYLVDAFTELKDKNVILNFLGDTTKFSPELQELIKKNKELNKDHAGMTLNLALNYGSRAEIVMAAKKAVKLALEGKLKEEELTENLFSSLLYTENQPDVDLIIRPSGEYRLSNFLLWQSAYAEIVIRDILWPDFTTDDFDECIKIYQSRNRRFGA